MSYKINKTDGILLVDLVDGRIDDITTDLTLIGRNFSGYGELFNENFVKLLENFAAVSPPSSPLVGQLWFDKSEGRLKIWNGEQFRSTDTTVVSSLEPQLLAGDIWIDSRRQQLYFNDGTGTKLAGPIYTRNQGPTGFRVETINDRFGNPKTVAKLIVNSTELAIISRETFEAALNQPGFGKDIQEGINISLNKPNFEFRGVSTFARQLIDAGGEPFNPDNFLKINANNVTTGTFTVNNDSGLRVGRDVSFLTRMQLFPKTVIQEVLDNNANYKLSLNSNNSLVDAIFADAAGQKLGVWTNNPDAALDVNGDVKISGNLTVLGDATTVETATLRVEDKNIELNFTSDPTPPDDLIADGGGITLLSSDGNKTFQWELVTNSWTSNVNADIGGGFVYKIGGQEVLSSTTLSNSVTSATGLQEIGALTTLTAANFNFDSSTMSVTDSLTIDSADDIIIANNRKITNLGDPVNPQDAATRQYVDDRVNRDPVHLEVDVTGVATNQINNHIKGVLDNMLPWATVENPPSGDLVANPFRKQLGTKAIIHVVARSATVVTNPSSQVSKSFVAVDSGGTQNQSVVQDFSFTNATNTVEFSISLDAYKTFEFQSSPQGGEWQFLFDGVQYIP